jgi:hypothetical protein
MTLDSPTVHRLLNIIVRVPRPYAIKNFLLLCVQPRHSKKPQLLISILGHGPPCSCCYVEHSLFPFDTEFLPTISIITAQILTPIKSRLNSLPSRLTLPHLLEPSQDRQILPARLEIHVGLQSCTPTSLCWRLLPPTFLLHLNFSEFFLLLLLQTTETSQPTDFT